jgi:GT2 family glycosyltransferase
MAVKPMRQSCNTPATSNCRPAEGLLADVSIVVPVAASEERWRSLLLDLRSLSAESELILIAVDESPSDLVRIVDDCELKCRVEWHTTRPGRARQMNLGAARSARPFVWFLHADSRLSADAIAALDRSLHSRSDALHYFDLAFQDDGPQLTRWNAVGARLRSRWLGLPFGDQGFCMRREVFRSLDGFDESAHYGEDHLLIWAARQLRIPLHNVGEKIATSARKYREGGWLHVTLRHAARTWRQAIPQAWKLWWSRLR